MDWSSLFKNLKDWQSFAGALIGAGIPISFWFFKEWWQARRKKKQNLDVLERVFIYEINKVINTRQTLKKFIDTQLADLKDGIAFYQAQGKYSLGMTFIPLFSVEPIEENLLQIEVESGYLMNKINQIYAMSKDFSLMVDDLREQFKETIRTNKEIAMGKLNDPGPQNGLFLKNVQDFEKMLRQDIFGTNIPIYLRNLIAARSAAAAIREMGMFHWKSKFAPHFKYFKNKHDLINFHKRETFDQIEIYLQDKVNKQIQEIEKGF